jgi:hypothetical protein
MKNIFLVLIVSFLSFITFGQCSATESEVVIKISTDDYGYEGYWELVPQGNACGQGTLLSGGNTAVGCGGAGLQAQTPGGYGNNVQLSSSPICLTTGVQYDIFYADDWGDGGFLFDVEVNGYLVESFSGIGLGGTYTFTAQEPLPYDLSVFNSSVYSYVSTGSYPMEARVFNNGTTTITSYNLNYSVNGGSPVVHTITGANLLPFEHDEIVHSTPLSISTNGVYTIKIWADQLNGSNLDQKTSNDTLTVQTEAGPGTPNYIDGYINSTFTVDEIVGPSNLVANPTDLDFHPVLSNMELWVINKGTENSGSSTVTVFNAGATNQTSVKKTDGNAWHFMSLTTGLAFSQNGNWGSAPGVYDANHNGGNAFTGPALWSSNMSIYAQPSGGNGSHLDMLHLSPYCQGIAAEEDNVFWVFDGYNKDIVRYDFGEDHGPGADDHSDGIVHRYSDVTVEKDPNNVVVSHLILDQAKKWLYVVDHGNNKVFRMDITSGAEGGTPSYPMNEPIQEYKRFTGYTYENVAVGLSKPAGIDIIDNRLIVSEYESGDIIIYDISSMPAVELGRITTGKTSVQGIKIGPDGRIWFVDKNTNAVYRINTNQLGLEEKELSYAVYPNPSNGMFNFNFTEVVSGNIRIIDNMGKVISSRTINTDLVEMEVNAVPGIYFAVIESNGMTFETKKIMIQ